MCPTHISIASKWELSVPMAKEHYSRMLQSRIATKKLCGFEIPDLISRTESQATDESISKRCSVSPKTDCLEYIETK